MKKNYNHHRIIFFWGIILLAIFTGCTHNNVDYHEKSNWAYWDIGENKDADVFLICPTVDLGEPGRYHMSLQDEETKTSFLGALNMERGIYENTCRLYAPYYRQATLNVYEMDEKAAAQYFDLAYQDVRGAFLYYLEHENQGSPLILAGFFQGADMCIRLMKEFFQDKTYSDLLVATYAIGWRVTPEEVATYPQLKMAQGERDTGVIVSFNTEAESITTSLLVPQRTLAINPLNWKTDSSPAKASLNLGACFTDYEENMTKEIPHFTGAYLDEKRGTLKVIDVDQEEYPPILSLFKPGIYHLYDYQFFYRNLQENVSKRTKRYVQQKNSA